MVTTRPGSGSGTDAYSAQLDTLRGLAVAGVLFHHYLPHDWLPVNLGGLGVKLFFVLSGYLITQKLLDCRGYLESGQALGLTLRRFYARRTLRIFPVYYLVLVLTLLLGVEGARSLAPWTFGYATNFYVAITGLWPGPFSPFWTLAVEEQFYLVWPWFILLAPRRGLWGGALFVVLAAPAFRVASISLGLTPDQVGVLLPACLDTLGIGAATAIAAHPASSRPPALSWLLSASLPAAVGAVALLWAPTLAYAAAFDLCFGIATAALVLSAANGITGWGARLLDLSALSSLGKISYGMYVVHAFAPLLVTPALEHSRLAFGGLALSVLAAGLVMRRWGAPAGARALLGLAIGALVLSMLAMIAARLGWLAPAHRDIWVYFGLCWLVSACLASLSWVWFEQPLNRFKRLFPYRAIATS